MIDVTKLTDEDFEEILDDDNSDYEAVTETKIIDKRRWVTVYEKVFKYKPDDTFWRISWERGSTEYQDGCDPEYQMRQVKPVEVSVTKYVPV